MPGAAGVPDPYTLALYALHLQKYFPYTVY